MNMKMWKFWRAPFAKLLPEDYDGGGSGRRSTLAKLVVKGILNAFVLVLSFTLFLIFVLGSYDFFKNVESNKCEMTWMFEYPEYIPIKLGNEMDTKYPMYGLYAYAEGKYVQPAVKQQFTGIPVLYIPGNAGSYKQVRSFASVALRKWLDSRTPFHFDFYSVDFNEELSGLYGYVLGQQSEYAHAAIQKIQSFYEEYHSVILIGHSMGGIVAKSIREENQPMSNVIFSLSAPHVRPILIFDPEQDIFYFHLSRNWTVKGNAGEGKDVSLVSIAGGDRDHLVPEGFTKWGRHLDIHTTTTAVPGVWASTDHLCIVWCKQFVFSVVRALFDLIEYRQPNGYYAVDQNPIQRQKILEYHFIKKSSGKSFHTAHPNSEFGKPPGSYWNELLGHRHCVPPTRTPTYLMFPMQIIKEKIKGNPEDHKIAILTTNTGPKNWIFGCTSQSIVEKTRYCSFGENLSHLSEIVPHIKRRRKLVHLKFIDIVKYSHLIVKMDPFNLKSCVDLEVYNELERSKQILVKFDTEDKIFYNLTFPIDGIISKLISWKISAIPQQNETCEGAHNSLGIFQHGNLKVNRFLKNESLVARFSDWNATTANVELYLDPSCKYTIGVRIASLETAGQIFRTYARLLPSFFASIVLMSLFFQKSHTDWLNFHRVLISNAYYLTVVPGFFVSTLLVFIPNDWPTMLDGPEYSVFLPIFCYLVAYAFVLFIAAGAWYVIIMCGNAFHAVFIKFITSRLGRWANFRVPMPGQVADFAFDFTFGKFPVIIAVFLISLSLATCGALGIAAGLALFIIKLFKMYEDLLDDLMRTKIQNVAEGLSPLNFQFSCAMLWFVITSVNIPSLIHWVKNFSFGATTQWDLSMYLCLMLTPAIAVLWQNYVPNFHPTLWLAHRYVFYVMGVTLVVWGTFRLYIVGFIITFVLITTAMCQLISSLGSITSKEENLIDRGPADNEIQEEEEEEEGSIAEEFRPLYENLQMEEIGKDEELSSNCSKNSEGEWECYTDSDIDELDGEASSLAQSQDNELRNSVIKTDCKPVSVETDKGKDILDEPAEEDTGNLNFNEIKQPLSE